MRDPNSMVRKEVENMFTVLEDIGWDEAHSSRKSYLDAALFTFASYTEQARAWKAIPRPRPIQMKSRCPIINPLVVASVLGDFVTIEAFCSAGEDLHKLTYQFGSPLSVATQCASLEMIEYLFEKGATVERIEAYWEPYYRYNALLRYCSWGAAAERGDLVIFKFILTKIPC